MHPDNVLPATLVAAAARPITELVRTVDPAVLSAPTPCTDFDVRALLHHLLHWGPVLESCARKEADVPPADADLVVGDWRKALEAQLDRMVAAWSDPAAWEGSTSMGGPDDLPAAMVGAMVMGELVVHGWDLGRAVGRSPTWDDDVLELVNRDVAATAAMGREMGVYGPEVPVPANAPTLDRLLGLTGRDPLCMPGPTPGSRQQPGAAG